MDKGDRERKEVRREQGTISLIWQKCYIYCNFCRVDWFLVKHSVEL